MDLLAVDDALARVLDQAPRMPSEQVALTQALDRVTAAPLIALRTQPPFAASAMDGYAVRAEDFQTGKALTVIGEAAAGQGFHAPLAAGQAVRIFTGAPVPPGADTILLQEHAERNGTHVIPTTDKDRGRHIRPAGLDFTRGDALIPQGVRLSPSTLALAAAMGHADVSVTRRPKIAILANGDELVAPGDPCGPDQIVASNQYAVAAMVEKAGGEPLLLGIAGDDLTLLAEKIHIAQAQHADILVTLGGASVGDRDLIRQVLHDQGMQLGFWKIAMRPGKPLIFGTLGAMRILGLPGNPVSSIICAKLFLVPLIKDMLGLPRPADPDIYQAVLGSDMPANDLRQDYVRASLHRAPDSGQWIATPFALQDSSMLRIIAQAQALIIRPPHAPAAAKGTPCQILMMD